MYFAMGPGCKHLYLKASCQEILVHSQIRTWFNSKASQGSIPIYLLQHLLTILALLALPNGVLNTK